MAQPNPQPGTAPVAPKLLADLERHVYPDRSMAWGTSNRARMLPLLEELITRRVEIGRAKYGRPLEAHNGRNALVDAWEEQVDGCFYLKQADMEGRDVAVALGLAYTSLFELTRLAAPYLEAELISDPLPNLHPSEDALPPPAPVNSERRSVRSEGGN
jgi:hypothetical protein